jgi:predicted ATPase/DNA-binding SARP family transcriptional activator
MGGPGHGPYWYAHWREGGRQRSRYLGKDPPPEAATQALPEEVVAAPAARSPGGGAAPLRVRSLGRLEVWRGSTDLHVETWRPRTATALFACLLGAAGHRLRREELAERLWPEEQPGAGLRNLRGAIYHLRRQLGQRGAREGYLLQEGAFLRLDPAPGGEAADDWLDAPAFERAAAGALARRDPDACRTALARYTGDYLPEEPYAEWAAATRETLARHHLALLLHLAALCRAAGEVGEAERRLRAALAVDPCHEEAATALMELLAARGRRGEALQVYQKVAAALDRELGLGPQAALEGLRARLLAEAAAPAAADFAPRLRLPGRASNLPSPLSSFVGRAWELAEVRSVLQGTRLLTLVGPGGCGKSRLAQEATGALLSDYPDGVWLVELAALVDPVLVPQAVAATLGVAEGADQSLRQVLADFLAPRELLLLLDNCEHLLEACAALAEHLLQHCPHLRILATSRQALGPAGEVAWLVPALAYPATGTVADAADLSRYEAVQLFAARARAHRPAFALNDANAGAVARICRQLDGIPLALELAAARLGALSVAEVAGRLGDRFALLSGGSRMALPRHQTLRATLDWSWELLGEGERRLLRRLTVFAGGWALEAAEAVLGADDGLPAGEVLDVLADLVAKSLVQVTEREGQSRYGLLEMVRQYARERLEASGEAATLHDRHLAYYLAVAEQAEPELTGPDQGIWLATLEREHDNLRAALTWARESGAGEAGLRLGGALWRFWYLRGYIRDGSAWLEGLLDPRRPVGGVPGTARIKALRGAGALAFRRGDYARAVAWGEEALALCDRLGDQQGRIGPLNLLALVARDQGRLARAGRLHEELQALCREVGARWDLAASLQNLAIVRRDQGAYSQAMDLLEESLAIKRELGDSSAICFTLNNLADVSSILGEFERAAALAQEGLALARQVGDKTAMAYAYVCLGYVATERGEYAAAEVYYNQGLALRRETDDRLGTIGMFINLGEVARRQADWVRAEKLYREALAQCRQGAGDYSLMPLCLEGLAAVLCADGQAERAARLLGAAATAQEGLEGVMLPSERAGFERTTATARAAVGVGPFAAAWAAGQALALEQAVAEALALPP